MKSTDTSKLFKQVKKGNYKAFNEMFKKHFEELCLYASNIVIDFEISKDIVQEVFIKVWNDRKTIPYFDKFELYLFKAVRNKSLDYLKNSTHKQKYYDYVVKKSDIIENFTYKVEQMELLSLIEEEIESLPPKAKQVFKYSRTNDLTYKEISNKMDISVKTVESHMGMVMKRLKSVVKSYFN